jgi:F0F1-type ATP synthase membrane subunit c/vacuolar-type H+-ATPase subunit K
VPMIAGVTQALGPVARPYFQSSQLAGLVEGLPVGIAYAETTGADSVAPDELLTGFTLAQWLAIAVLVVGALFFGLAKPAATAVNQVAKK